MNVTRRAWMSSMAAATLVSTTVAQDKAVEKSGKPSQEELEKAFSEKMSDTTLTGNFSVVGKETKPASLERYELKKVAKVTGDLWLFEARIKYGKTDVTVPLTLRMIWAEDTPMITLTNMTLPGLGEGFGARVIFHGDRYAGTWQHGKVGGHMWGTIDKTTAAKSD